MMVHPVGGGTSNELAMRWVSGSMRRLNFPDLTFGSFASGYQLSAVFQAGKMAHELTANRLGAGYRIESRA